MGLDMYLEARDYVSPSNWIKDSEGHSDLEDNPKFTSLVNVLDAHQFITKDSFNGITCMIPVGYWRKANAIHRWFVYNCGGGERDSGLYVDISELHDLKKICLEVLADHSKAMELLPPMEGFFFGTTEVGDWYFRDLEHTVKMIEKIEQSKYDTFEYTSSW